MLVSYHHLQTYRSQTFRWLQNNRLKTKDEAIDFVKERGFIYFWPIKEFLLPSLWVAVAGNRPVADKHDDPGHITWRWKDSSLGTHDWYYAKVLRKKATLIAMDVVPYFYALSENYGDPKGDYLVLYEQGRLSQEAKVIYEVLLYEGSADTIRLRVATRMTNRESESRFNRALAELQSDFKVIPVAVTQAGSWHYAFSYDLVFRHYPEIIEQARFITPRQARLKLIELYIRSVGAVTVNDIVRLFQWQTNQVYEGVQNLAERGFLHQDVEVEHCEGRYIVLSELIERSL